jgi:hypothetical protein
VPGGIGTRGAFQPDQLRTARAEQSRMSWNSSGRRILNRAESAPSPAPLARPCVCDTSRNQAGEAGFSLVSPKGGEAARNATS